MAMNRPEYRDAKTPRAVTVYTIAQESRHVIFKNVPALSGEETIIQDLLNRCSLYGTVETWRQLDKQQQEEFTLSPLLVTFATIEEARWVKRKMDDQVFYANLLQVYYAPEYDTVEDIRIKLEDRRTKVHARIQHVSWDDIDDSDDNKKKSRKRTTNKYQYQQQQQHQRYQNDDQQQQQQLVGSAVLIEQQQQEQQRSTVIQDSTDELLLESIGDTTSTQTTMEPSIDGILPHVLEHHHSKTNPLATNVAPFIPTPTPTPKPTTKRRRI